MFAETGKLKSFPGRPQAGEADQGCEGGARGATAAVIGLTGGLDQPRSVVVSSDICRREMPRVPGFTRRLRKTRSRRKRP